MPTFLVIHEFDVRDMQDKWLDTAELHAEGERLMDALLDLERVNEEVSFPSTASEADRGVIVAELNIDAPDPLAAITLFMTLVRTAIHAIGGSTPGWEAGLPSIIAPKVEYELRRVALEYV